MRILHRYVLREFLVPLIYCLLGFVGIYVMFEAFSSFNRISESSLSWTIFVAYFAGYLSPYLRYLVPAALLLAALYTMWNFCRHSELTAMRAGGIGFGAITAPLLGTAIVFSILISLSDEFYAPQASEWAQHLRDAKFKEEDSRVFRNVPFYNRMAHRIWRVDEIDAQRPTVLKGVQISIDREDGSREVDILASRAEYLDGVWWLFEPRYRYTDKSDNAMADPTPALSKLTVRAFPEFDETPHDFSLMNKEWGNYSVRDMLRYFQTHEVMSAKEQPEKVYDIHARLAAPLSCLIITLLAIPFGIATGRQSVFRGVIGALALFLGYNACLMGFMILAKNGLVPPRLSAWLPHGVFLALGIYFFHRQR